MMLVINTAFMTANLALKTDKGAVLKDIDAKSKHSENVLKTIDEMCQEMNVDILQVDTVAVVTGPGSFTGLRIGVAIAKALGCVREDIKFISLSSLELMAYIIGKQGLCKKKFTCALNALSDNFFVAEFDENGIKTQEERMIDRQEYSAVKTPIFTLKGDGVSGGVAELEISCEDLLEFAVSKEKKEEFVTLEELLPKYLRLSQAEDNLLKKCKKDC